MALPRACAAEGEEDELTGGEHERRVVGLERDLERRRVRPSHLRDGIVVDGDEEASQEFAVQIGRDADAADDEECALRGRVVEHRIDERAVHDRHGDEQPVSRCAVSQRS